MKLLHRPDFFFFLPRVLLFSKVERIDGVPYRGSGPRFSRLSRGIIKDHRSIIPREHRDPVARCRSNRPECLWSNNSSVNTRGVTNAPEPPNRLVKTVPKEIINASVDQPLRNWNVYAAWLGQANASLRGLERGRKNLARVICDTLF